MCVGSLAGVTYLRYTVLMSSNKSETAVHCCDPALSVLVMLVSRNVFHIVSALQSYISFWLIRSLVDPTLAVFIVCGPLQLVTHSTSSTAYLKILGLLPTTITSNTYSAQCFQKIPWRKSLKMSYSQQFDILGWVLASTEGWSFRGLGVGGEGGVGEGNSQGSAPMYKTSPFIYHFWRKRKNRHIPFMKNTNLNTYSTIKQNLSIFFECCRFSGQ